MIRYQSQHQLPMRSILRIEEFQTPFELRLSQENLWVKLAQALPWDALVTIYCRALSKKHGRPAKNPYIINGLKRAGFTGGWLENNSKKK